VSERLPARTGACLCGAVRYEVRGTLRPIVGKERPLKDAPLAHKEVLAPGAYGKIVLVP